MLTIERNTESFAIKQNFVDALSEWGKKFDEILSRQKSPLLHASLSYRHALGFVITARDADVKNLMHADLIFVERWDLLSDRITICGEREPPSESFMHAHVYQNRSTAIFTFFIESPLLAKKARLVKIPSTTAQPIVTIPSVREVEKKLGLGNIVLIGDQAVLSLGCTADDAGEPVLGLLQEAYKSSHK